MPSHRAPLPHSQMRQNSKALPHSQRVVILTILSCPPTQRRATHTRQKPSTNGRIQGGFMAPQPPLSRTRWKGSKNIVNHVFSSLGVCVCARAPSLPE